MKIVDLTGEYKKSILKENSLSGYEAASPALFSHYFKFWADRKLFKLSLNSAQVDKRKKLIIGNLKIVEEKFEKSGFDISKQKIIIFVGQNTTNGHAFLDEGKFVVWLPIEAYKTKLQAHVFISHEIIHAFHYSQNPDFYFGNLKSLRDIIIGDNLIEEGLATFATKEILGLNDGIVLWADYITPPKLESWLKQCEKRQKEAYKWLSDHFDKKLGDSELFGGLDTGDIFHSRGGYWAGLKIVEQLAKNKKYGLAELLKLPKGEFKELIKKKLAD
jgi:uncharacterized protein YjaZ